MQELHSKRENYSALTWEHSLVQQTQSWAFEYVRRALHNGSNERSLPKRRFIIYIHDVDLIPGPFHTQNPLIATNHSYTYLPDSSHTPPGFFGTQGIPTPNTHLQARRKTNTIPNSRAQANHVHQRARAMHTRKAPVERQHILAMRRRINALLPILDLLRLAETDELRRLWTDEDEVEEAANEGRGERVEHAPLVCGREGAVVGGGPEVGAGVGECDEEGEGGLKGEVAGEDALLEGAELGALEGLVGGYAADEGLGDCQSRTGWRR